MPFRPKRARPYLYTDDEINALLRAALNLPPRRTLRPWTYHCLLGLLNVSGMRIGEARNLKLPDVDLKAAVLTIRGAKFGKSRLVPLHDSSRDILADCITRRERFFERQPISSYLFVSSRLPRLDIGDIHRTFYLLSRQIGLRGLTDSRGPRLHDMRHNSGTRIIPSTGRQSVLLREDRAIADARWRHNQSMFRKAKTLSLGRYRGVWARVAVVLARACSLSCMSACRY